MLKIMYSENNRRLKFEGPEMYSSHRGGATAIFFAFCMLKSCIRKMTGDWRLKFEGPEMYNSHRGGATANFVFYVLHVKNVYSENDGRLKFASPHIYKSTRGELPRIFACFAR